MKLEVRNLRGEVVRSIEVRNDVFGVPMKRSLVHQVMVGQMANSRQGTASTKTRAEMSGGGRKPRPQKGTGRGRQGSIRSPLWRSGGVAFGPTPRSYRQRTPKRMRRRAILAVLSERARNRQIRVMENLDLPRAKTKEMVQMFAAIGAQIPLLLVADGADVSVVRSARNIPGATTTPAALLNTVALLKNSSLVITLESIRRIEEIWGGTLKRRVRTEPVGDRSI